MRDVSITIRVTEDEKTELQAAAIKAGVSVSMLIRLVFCSKDPAMVSAVLQRLFEGSHAAST